MQGRAFSLLRSVLDPRVRDFLIQKNKLCARGDGKYDARRHVVLIFAPAGRMILHSKLELLNEGVWPSWCNNSHVFLANLCVEGSSTMLSTTTLAFLSFWKPDVEKTIHGRWVNSINLNDQHTILHQSTPLAYLDVEEPSTTLSTTSLTYLSFWMLVVEKIVPGRWGNPINLNAQHAALPRNTRENSSTTRLDVETFNANIKTPQRPMGLVVEGLDASRTFTLSNEESHTPLILCANLILIHPSITLNFFSSVHGGVVTSFAFENSFSSQNVALVLSYMEQQNPFKVCEPRLSTSKSSTSTEPLSTSRYAKPENLSTTTLDVENPNVNDETLHRPLRWPLRASTQTGFQRWATKTRIGRNL